MDGFILETLGCDLPGGRLKIIDSCSLRTWNNCAKLGDMDAVGREAQLKGFEFAKAVTLVLEPFTLENGLLTPKFKIKRPQAKAYFAKAIADMYAEIAESDPSSRKLL
ncbi:hypothetical protein AgCh_031306 [Apium graveolens]